ncbi:MAG: transketolase [Spirochaetae bacterium HGW-Spirochaetae-7]|jgi:transketolase|nr:MAG: transketolase [Spirochaetae bacterium HGW-Spirochaetae-7]
MADIEKMSARDAFGLALSEIGAENVNVVLLGADAIGSTRAAGFAKRFPDRTFNFGIAEQEMISAAAGFAACGKIPVATAYGFLISLRACEQVRSDICYPNLNVKLMSTHTGLTMAEAGTTHHSTEDIAIMRSFANMTIVAPSDSVETVKAVRAVIDYPGPVYLRMGRGETESVNRGDYEFVIGKAITLREGTAVTIIACGIMVAEALKAAAKLSSEGVSARVINMHTIKPLDVEAVLRAARETGAIVTAEEHTVIGGLGEAVAGVVCENSPVPVVKVGLNDCYGIIGPEDMVKQRLGLDAESIFKAAKKAILHKVD